MCRSPKVLADSWVNDGSLEFLFIPYVDNLASMSCQQLMSKNCEKNSSVSFSVGVGLA